MVSCQSVESDACTPRYQNGKAAKFRAAASHWLQTWKLSPQPQRPFSFGLVKVKPDASDFTS
jgi:hypothetical protein